MPTRMGGKVVLLILLKHLELRTLALPYHLVGHTWKQTDKIFKISSKTSYGSVPAKWFDISLELEDNKVGNLIIP